MCCGLRRRTHRYTSRSRYLTLAQLARYEHCEVSLDVPPYRTAMAKLEADDVRRQHADFTLSDLAGAKWSLKNLRGKVVLINFWATGAHRAARKCPTWKRSINGFARAAWLSWPFRTRI